MQTVSIVLSNLYKPSNDHMAEDPYVQDAYDQVAILADVSEKLSKVEALEKCTGLSASTEEAQVTTHLDTTITKGTYKPSKEFVTLPNKKSIKEFRKEYSKMIVTGKVKGCFSRVDNVCYLYEHLGLDTPSWFIEKYEKYLSDFRLIKEGKNVENNKDTQPSQENK